MKEFKKVILSESNNPYVNLSYENYLMNRLDTGESILLFYTNRPSIVYGRFQNPWIECKTSDMLLDDIDFVRRQSGGGCVYHDLGNLNLSFISHRSVYSKGENNRRLINTLNELGLVSAYISERGDIRIKKNEADYKISGSAYKEKKDRAIHHLTLLFKTDLRKLNAYLLGEVDKANVKTRSTMSRPSQVINIGDRLSKDNFIKALASNVGADSTSGLNFLSISQASVLDELNSCEDGRDFLKKMMSATWIFDETPKFDISFEKFSITLKKGHVLNFEAPESWHPSLQLFIQDAIKQKKYHINYFLSFLTNITGIDTYKNDLEMIENEMKKLSRVYRYSARV